MMKHRCLLAVALSSALLTLLAALNCHAADTSPSSSAQLLQAFQKPQYFPEQFEVARAIVALKDRSVLPRLASYLIDEDRHQRANAAYIFAALGDARGFETLSGILTDQSERSIAQIREDRYYAAHVFGDLKDPKALPILIPLLSDEEVNYIVPWSLAQIGDQRAVPSLIKTLTDRNPSMRVLAIHALEQLNAHEAIPALYRLLNDNERANFGDEASVADTAKAAIAKLDAH